jgi:hypothetical protein
MPLTFVSVRLGDVVLLPPQAVKVKRTVKVDRRLRIR